MTKLSGEFQFIESLRTRAIDHPAVELGIGDDAAILRAGDERILVAADMLLEEVHFTIPPATPVEVGRKALAVNLSDIAAMAGRPTSAFVTVAFPKNRGGTFAHEVMQGVCKLADQFEVALAGGDTNTWDGPCIISVTVVGEVTGKKAVQRSGAQPGDWLLVTGELGGTLGGKHLRFIPRVHEAIHLHETVDLHAMIDISDGLAADLWHILDESQVGAVLREESIPISTAAKIASGDKTPLQRALSDGEDFELLFAVSEKEAQQLLAEQPFDPKLTHLGQIVLGEGCQIENSTGERRPLGREGWQHEI